MATAERVRSAAREFVAAPVVRLVHAKPDFWGHAARGTPNARAHRRQLHELVGKMMNAPGVELFDAVESGVPPFVIDVISGATGLPATLTMELFGLSATTFRRKVEANETLPDVVGHRVMGYLRVAATLRRLLEESGDAEAMKAFDLEAWLADWIREALPELGGKTPAEMLRNPEGLRAVEQVLERMRGGLPA